MKSILRRHNQNKESKSQERESTENPMDKFHSVVLEALRVHR